MKSSKGRAALCWILAVLSIPVGIVLTSVLYALIPGENTALRLYLFNIPSEIFCFALPAFSSWLPGLSGWRAFAPPNVG